MISFLERNPKEKAVEEALHELALNGYESKRPDPADNIFAVVERLKLQGVEANSNGDKSES